MKDKIKARIREIWYEPMNVDLWLGVAAGTTATLIGCSLLRANFDGKGLYVPDRLVSQMVETGEVLIARKGDAVVVIAATKE